MSRHRSHHRAFPERQPIRDVLLLDQFYFKLLFLTMFHTPTAYELDVLVMQSTEKTSVHFLKRIMSASKRNPY